MSPKRVVHFAIGLTVVILLVRFLLTGDLLMAVQDRASGFSLASAVWPMLVEGLIIIGASVAAYYAKIWAALLNLIDGAAGKPEPEEKPKAEPQQESLPAGTGTASHAKMLRQKLFDAARVRDTEQVLELAEQIATKFPPPPRPLTTADLDGIMAKLQQAQGAKGGA